MSFFLFTGEYCTLTTYKNAVIYTMHQLTHLARSFCPGADDVVADDGIDWFPVSNVYP